MGLWARAGLMLVSLCHLQCGAPVQFVFLGVPQAHLFVMAAREEGVLGGMCGQAPHLIHMTLQGTKTLTVRLPLCVCVCLCKQNLLILLNTRVIMMCTCTMATKPSEKVPLSMAFRVVPTNSSSPSMSARVRTAPNISGI